VESYEGHETCEPEHQDVLQENGHIFEGIIEISVNLH
jgi:hypothetical protein